MHNRLLLKLSCLDLCYKIYKSYMNVGGFVKRNDCSLTRFRSSFILSFVSGKMVCQPYGIPEQNGVKQRRKTEVIFLLHNISKNQSGL
jgi:hypothetical protein